MMESRSHKQWMASEDAILDHGLKERWHLAQLQNQLIGRSAHAITRRAQIKGYGVQTNERGEKNFIDEIRRKHRNNSEAMEVVTTHDDIEIVQQNPDHDSCKHATLEAINILEINQLRFTTENIKTVSEIILDSRIGVT